MKAEFFRPAAPAQVVGTALWREAGVESSSEEEAVAVSLARVFRPASVVVDDPSLRSFGASGPVVLQPGTLQWFRAAATTRAEAEGLAVRFVPAAGGRMGWDPAGAYRTFAATDARRHRAGPPS